MYGFHKGKNADGYDVFRREVFRKGRKDLLMFITRNSDKISKENNIEKKIMPSYINQIYVEIDKIRTEQLQLESKITELEKRNIEVGIESNALMSDFYTKYV